MSVLSFDRVTYQYPGENHNIVDGLSFQVQAGSLHCILGVSGCGKSTLGRVLIHLLESSGGSMTFSGADITSVKGRELFALRRQMQMIFQDPYS